MIAPSLTDANVDATAAYALGGGAADWLRRGVGRTALLVGSDGRTETVTAPAAREALVRSLVTTTRDESS